MEWRIITGLPDYEISNSGRVRRRTSAGGTWAGRPLRGYIDAGGYVLFRLRRDGGSKMYRAHRLVLLAFVGPPPDPSDDGAHNDGNRRNNHISNLRWATRTSNMADTLVHGTRSYGEKRSWSKLTDDAVRDIRRRWKEQTAGQRQMAREYGVSLGVLQRALSGKSWSHVTD
jgi:hypothetical protein